MVVAVDASRMGTTPSHVVAQLEHTSRPTNHSMLRPTIHTRINIALKRICMHFMSVHCALPDKLRHISTAAAVWSRGTS